MTQDEIQIWIYKSIKNNLELNLVNPGTSWNINNDNQR